MIRYLSRWHSKVALRYLPIVEKIRELKLENSNILEIGSGSLGITPYLGKRITGVDFNFTGPQTDLLTKVKSSANKIPFKDRSFNVVLMVDIIEHLPQNSRKNALNEAFRIAKKLLVIAVPEGNLSIMEDELLSDYYRKTYQKDFSFFREHQKYKLPAEDYVSDTIKELSVKYKRKLQIRKISNVNMRLHQFLMKGWMTKNPLIDIFFRKILIMLIPIFRKMNTEPTYRKIYFITFK